MHLFPHGPVASLELDRLIFPARRTRQTPPVVVLCNFFHPLIGGCARQDTPCGCTVQLFPPSARQDTPCDGPLKVAFARYLSSLILTGLIQFAIHIQSLVTASTNLKVFLSFLEGKLSIQLDRQKKETVVFRLSASHGAWGWSTTHIIVDFMFVCVFVCVFDCLYVWGWTSASHDAQGWSTTGITTQIIPFHPLLQKPMHSAC